MAPKNIQVVGCNKRRRYAVEPGMGKKPVQPEVDSDSEDEACATDFIAAAHDCIKQMTNKKYRNDKTKASRLKEVENAAMPLETTKPTTLQQNANSDSETKSTASEKETTQQYWAAQNSQSYSQHALHQTPYAQSWNNTNYETAWPMAAAGTEEFPRPVVEQMHWESPSQGTFGSSHYTTSFSTESARSFGPEGRSFGTDSRLYEYGSMSGSVVGSSQWDSSSRGLPSIPNKWSASQVSQISSPARISCGDSEIDEDEIIHL